MPTDQPPRNVIYLHHTRDHDGDVVFYFLDHERAGEEPMQSSPITGIRRYLSAVLDLDGHGSLTRYLLTTKNTEYLVQMPRDKADHLAREVGGYLADLLGPKTGP
jgi:hypothetical protein